MNYCHDEIKLIALDLDGTLLNGVGEISELNRKAVKEAEQKGIIVILTTGRPYLFCRKIANSLQLSSYLVTVNGSEIFDHKGHLIERHILSNNLIQWMWDLTKEYNAGFWATSIDDVWRGEMPVDIEAHEWLKFGFIVEDNKVRMEINNLLAANAHLELSNSKPTNIEVNAAGINKARALEKVCGLLGCNMENVMAIGDSLNDMAMIKAAGFGVAMGNAQDNVKDTADWITESNENDGVAIAIQQWILRTVNV
ncbi:phosphoglycolate phosphatase [Peribacillus sp. SCS-155]|uniref:phosphoglycolate phosphatase n=1 Tax=Peribacillus sedimenti TaxID=3115297 RepID=UPI003906AB33